jgi:hypothetical protein
MSNSIFSNWRREKLVQIKIINAMMLNHKGGLGKGGARWK